MEIKKLRNNGPWTRHSVVFVKLFKVYFTKNDFDSADI